MTCQDYEIELSALFDGESEPRTALELVDHVAECSSCASFVKELRAVQNTIEGAFPTADDTHQPPIDIPQKTVLTRVPKWTWGLAAGWLVAVGMWFSSFDSSERRTVADMRDGEMVIRLEEDKGLMTDERFVTLMSELLRADRRYQSQMLDVLDELHNDDESGETRQITTMSDASNSDKREWSPQSGPPSSTLK